MLKGKGIEQEFIDAALDEIDEEQYLEILDEALAAKAKTLSGKNKEQIRASLLRFAASRGFEAGIAGDYYSTDQDSIEDNYWPSGNNGGDLYYSTKKNANYALNYSLCSIDRDDDGIMARYSTKEYIYSDPQPVAVIQAPPYFADLRSAGSDFLGDSSISYSVKGGMSYEETDSESVSFGLGVDIQLETNVADIEFYAGYELEKSWSVTEGIDTSFSLNWSADWVDQIILSRVPAVIYHYQYSPSPSS